jgi:signal transduction histidine kinase
MTVSATELAPSRREILILAPTGQDAPLIAEALAREGIESVIFQDVSSLCRHLGGNEAGALLLAEEALNGPAMTLLTGTLARQQAWSDIPVVVMTGTGDAGLASHRVLKAFEPAGNVTLLERPCRSITLISVLQVALRARMKQYEVKELLEFQERATRLRDEFISIASHELKTPLTALKLQTQLNKRMHERKNAEAFTPDRVVKLMNVTDHQVDRLARLVEDMLDVSRISSGKLTIQKMTFDLADLAREVIERFQPQFQAVSCLVDFRADDNVVGSWDRYRIEQVLNNLFTNAIRYSPGKPLHVSIERAGSSARIVVRDEGAGIAKENLGRIFERFERAVNAANISGLGLGLYICREILETHGGSIQAESEPGNGATFTVTLPLGA